jgi:carbamate kinase
MIVVVALGGNAIKKPKGKGSYEEQYETVREVCHHLASAYDKGYNLIITHGNGPQVGDILLQQEASKNLVSPMPLDVCGAFSQGFIGYMIQQNLKNIIGVDVATLITQVAVDKEDPAFKNPTKPIGPFYDEVEAEEMRRKGLPVIEDSGRGYRRVVASPKPTRILEARIIKHLVENNVVVIAAGGGGVPVFRDGKTEGIEAVIDKDLTACELAIETGADILLIATDVDNVFLNYRSEKRIALHEVHAPELEKYLAEGQFGVGSMEPKVYAVLQFVRKTGNKAIITSDKRIMEALEGRAGTVILP